MTTKTKQQRVNPTRTSRTCSSKWRIIEWALFVLIAIGTGTGTYYVTSQQQLEEESDLDELAPAFYATFVVCVLLLVAMLFFVCEHCHTREEAHYYKQVQAVVKDDEVNSSMDHRDSSPPGVKDSDGGDHERKRSIMQENTNKQLLNAFMADQKRSHELVGSKFEDSMDLGFDNSAAFGGTLNDNNHHQADDLSYSNNRKNNILSDRLILPDWHQTKPVADLFSSATVLSADIKNFTAWSSVREPSQAFSLLEAIYFSFDVLAHRRRIFKVDNLFDSYTAVCGLPERRPDHAVAMCHFARGCLRRFRSLTHMLEEKLGPETSDLSLRVGINSGPVMAGILRGGSQARFQLFGETVTLAAKMEGAGAGGRIHVSKECATQLTEQGKGHWLQRRDDKVVTSKGDLQTFWLLDDVESRRTSRNAKVFRNQGSEISDDSMADDDGWEYRGRLEQSMEMRANNVEEANSKMMRLVDWNCEVMLPLLKMIVARRSAEKQSKGAPAPGMPVSQLEGKIGRSNNVLDEVEEVISLPHYDARIQRKIKSDPDIVRLGFKVEAQLREYVLVIAKLYRKNPFHNFAHASHVTMSTMKLLSRIVAPDEVIVNNSPGKKKRDVDSELHDYTYGITSDPLTQFAVILAALIHDVDHRGVPNFILCKEEKELAAVYDNKSVAEQNSVDMAWEALMDNRFRALRKCIYANEAELKRFRVLLVNCVMSTDIFDKQLSALRKARWEKAFQVPDENANQEDINRKATIVIEYLIQASDVSHTMQHWHVYQKWNERLFHEMYSAYRMGRSDKDPTEGWYKGEIWFFDNYVIPLAKKLHQCGVFGVSSDEYLNYAVNNRNEWEEKGQKIVRDMIEKYSAMMDVEVREETAPRATRDRR